MLMYFAILLTHWSAVLVRKLGQNQLGTTVKYHKFKLAGQFHTEITQYEKGTIFS